MNIIQKEISNHTLSHNKYTLWIAKKKGFLSDMTCHYTFSYISNGFAKPKSEIFLKNQVTAQRKIQLSKKGLSLRLWWKQLPCKWLGRIKERKCNTIFSWIYSSSGWYNLRYGIFLNHRWCQTCKEMFNGWH